MASPFKADLTNPEQVEDILKEQAEKIAQLEMEQKIEVALERVRSRAMYMHQSSELKDVVSIMYDEMEVLGIAKWGCNIMICHQDKEEFEFWLAEETGSDQSRHYFVKGKEHPIYRNIWMNWENQGDPFILHHKDEYKKDFDKYWIEETDFKDLPNEVKASVYDRNEVYLAYASMKHGLLNAISYENPPEQSLMILSRFAVVFEQTYTRFLDLQKAEALAKEAQIEVALERVRSKSLAMKNSQELQEVIFIVFEQLNELGISMDVSFLQIFDDSHDTIMWVANPQHKHAQQVIIPYFKNIILDRVISAREMNENFFSDTYSKRTKNAFYKKAFIVSDLRNLPLKFQTDILNKRGYSRSQALSKNVGLGVFNLDNLVYTNEENALILRFLKVFDQAYARFLDLQKAEALARESQIEAALERVRAASMAMHRSEEIKEVIAVTFNQIQNLGVPVDGCLFHIFEDDSKDFHLWTATPEQLYSERINFPYWNHPLCKNFWRARDAGESFTSFKLTLKQTQNFYSQMATKSNLGKAMSKKRSTRIREMKHGIYMSFDFQKLSSLCLFNFTDHIYSEEENKVISRFSQVFEQSYTRFLDLQKAEGQTREAQIEASLERVRAQTMAMHESDELSSVVAAMFKEYHQLELANELSRVTMSIVNDETDGGVEFWTTKMGGQELVTRYSYNLKDLDPWKELWIRWKDSKQIERNKVKFTATLEGKELKEILDFGISKNIVSSDEITLIENLGMSKLVVQTVWFSHGVISIDTATQLSEAVPEGIQKETLDILQRFAVVFEQTYTRFLDLQKAEAQAKEAQIEASLERVRAVSLSIHHTDQLQKVVNSVNTQLQKLGLQLDGTLISIRNENQDKTLNSWVNTKLSDARFSSLEYYKGLLHTNLLNFIQKGKGLYIEKHPTPRVIKWYSHLFKSPGWEDRTEASKRALINSIQNYVRSSWGTKHAVLTMLRFSGQDFTNEEHEILERFAKVFDQCYTRFLDLQKAEKQAREAQIEAALERVRSRSMAMHDSQELSEVVTTMFSEFEQFGLTNHLTRTYISIMIDEDSGDTDMWITALGGAEISSRFQFSHRDDGNWNDEYQAFTATAKRKRKETIYELVHQGQVWDDLIAFATETGILTPAELEVVKESEMNQCYEYSAWFAKGMVGIQKDLPLSEEGKNILKRFTAVFEQTYTRFLDLQKAEALAREAQIEASLERVRSKSMSMQHSSQLNEVVGELYNQTALLNITDLGCNINVFDEDKNTITSWMSGSVQSVLPQGYRIIGRGHAYFRKMWKEWELQSLPFLISSKGAQLERYINYNLEKTEQRLLPEEFKELIRSPKEAHFTYVNMKCGQIEGVNSFAPMAEDTISILVRFAKVFDQSYTRFLDLQKAEAQAREAQVEAALEKVRSRSLAMNTTEELEEVVGLVLEKLKELNIENDGEATIFTYEKGSRDAVCWLASDLEYSVVRFSLPSPSKEFDNRIWKSRDKGIKYMTDVIKSEKLKSYFGYLFDHTDFKYIPEERKKWILEQESYSRSIAFSERSAILMPSYTGKVLNEEQGEILVRFSNGFDQAYTRFLDLQIAEKQKTEIEKVFKENQRLLHSILPAAIAEKIRKGIKTTVRRFDEVSILFADIVGFTRLSDKISPQKVVGILNDLFSRFDDLTDKYQLEKIKTIGDAYMVAAGVPEEKDNHAVLMFDFAKDMLDTLEEFNKSTGTSLKIRIGISSGPVVAGVIGKKKFAYDLWGDTVNTAARMEAYGIQNCIQISPSTYNILKEDHEFEKIPDVDIKGKGKMDLYLWPCG